MTTSRRRVGVAAPPAHDSAPESPARIWRWAPFVALVVAAALYNGTGMVQAVDTWISLAAGRHIAAHGVGTDDPFCFTARPASTGQAAAGSFWSRAAAWAHPGGWVNQKWLFHRALFAAHAAGGSGALVALRFAAYLALAALLLVAARAAGASWPAAGFAVAGALVVARPFADFRAQEATLVCTAAALLLLGAAVRRSSRILWVLVPLLALWCNLHGGYVFGIIAAAVYGAAGVRWGREGRWRGLGREGARTAALVLLAALAAVVVASPYRLANLSQALAIAGGPDAALWRRVNEWAPAIAPGARIGEVVPFFVFLAALVAAVAATAWPGGATPASGARRRGRDDASATAPPLDAAAALLAALAVAMALRSMRFVPLAAVVAAPVLAGALDAAAHRLHRRPGRSRLAARGLPWLAAVLAAGFAAYCGVRWSRAYSEPWPLAARSVTVFERMTAGHRRGPELGDFLRANTIGGRAFGFWEEGGFLAWAQRPEPADGSLPVRLFIDGRAQEAFAGAIVPDYIELAVGGPAGAAAVAAGRALSGAELAAMAAWTDARMKREGMWLAFIPEERRNEGIARALAASPSWRVVFQDEFHSVLADRNDERGRRLDEHIERGEAVFPGEQARLLTQAVRAAYSMRPEVRRRGLEAAVQAYRERPSVAAAMAALRLAAGELRPEAVRFASSLVAEYRSHEMRLLAEPGFAERAGATIAAAQLLAEEARRSGRAAEVAPLAELVRQADLARARVLRRTMWWG